MEQKIKEILLAEHFDAVIIETIYMAVYVDMIRMFSHAKIILRAHNVEHEIWQKVAQNKRRGITKVYLSILVKQLKRFESGAIQHFDAVFCISKHDIPYFQSKIDAHQVFLIPFAIRLSSGNLMPDEAKTDNLFSIASMDWQPNVDGLRWFVNRVWGQIRKRFPHVTLRIAGRNMPADFQTQSEQRIEVVGEVSDAKQFMIENGILIVPLWAGSGIRIKIIEAMSLAKVVISTTVGKQGIDAEHKKHILIADTPEEFVEAVDFCFSHPQICKEIARNASELVNQNYNLTAVAGILDKILSSLVANKKE
jgi:glycosyltransferase involved in cell wall biosynthesis